MIRLIFSEIKYMNGMFFSKTRYMIGVGFKILARTPLPKLPPSYPPTPLPRAYCTLYEVYLRNKETQQTLRVIVSIQYDASF